MKHAAIALALILCAPYATLAMNAPQPKAGVVTQRKMFDAANELLNKMNADGELRAQTSALIDQQTESLNDIPCGAGAIPEVKRLLEDALDITTMRNQMARIYVSNFTLAELEWMLDFYETPLGKKWLTAQPKINRTMTSGISARIKAAEPKISTAVAVATKDSQCQMKLNRNRR